MIVRRAFLVLLLATAAAACSQEQAFAPDSEAVSNAASEDMELTPEAETPQGRASREAGPDIGPRTAPGVAFNYRYAFRLDAARVAEVQQEHQRLCERYTVNRCRITGMTYRAVNEDDVEAMLSFRVDPSIAGQFGRESVQAVTTAEGMLTDSEISGTEVGSAIQSAGRDLAALEAELARIEARIRDPRVPDKGELEYQAQMLRQQIRDLRGRRDTQQQSLATTPMQFRYGSGALAPGFDQPPSLADALEDTGDDFLYSLTVLLVVLVRLLPWAVAGLLVWGVVRYVRRRWLPKPPEAVEAAA
jgi:hypothetical protein